MSGVIGELYRSVFDGCKCWCRPEAGFLASINACWSGKLVDIFRCSLGNTIFLALVDMSGFAVLGLLVSGWLCAAVLC